MRSRSVPQTRWLLAALAFVLFGGCAENRPTFFIREVKVPQGAECTLEPGNPYISQGTLDVAFASRYLAGVTLINQTFDRSEGMSLYLDNGGITIEGAEIELHQDSPEGALIDVGGGQTSFTTYSSGYVPSGKPGDFTQAVIPIEIVPPSLGIDLGAQLESGDPPFIRVIAGIRVFGHGTHGYAEETPQFFFPITVCYGCLLVFPPEADDPENPAGICDSTESPMGDTCTPGQDGPIDCRLCRNSRPELCAR